MQKISEFINWVQRKRHSKGFGVHSPFAFDLITKLIYEEQYVYYAYSDIAQLLENQSIRFREITPYNQLCFRLVNHFKPRRILEINSEEGINTLFLTAPDAKIISHCIEESEGNRAIACHLLKEYQRKTVFEKNLQSIKNTTFDAIFINPLDNAEISIEALRLISRENTFWVIHPIKTASAELFWKQIVNDENVRITFDKKQTGIAFLNSSYHKLNYLI